APFRLRILDPKRNDDLVGLAGDGDFAADVFAVVAPLGEDQQHRPAAVDGIGDLVVEGPARAHIARRDPAAHAATLALGDHRLRRPTRCEWGARTRWPGSPMGHPAPGRAARRSPEAGRRGVAPRSIPGGWPARGAAPPAAARTLRRPRTAPPARSARRSARRGP